MLNISIERSIQWVKDPFWYNFKTSSFTMFIAEDERTSVNSSLGSSNALLVNGATSGFLSGLKNSSIDILPTLFTNHVAL